MTTATAMISVDGDERHREEVCFVAVYEVKGYLTGVFLMSHEKMVPRKPLHPSSSLSKAKLQAMRKSSTDRLLKSLEPGQPHAFKVRKNGTIMDGHHRIAVFARARGRY